MVKASLKYENVAILFCDL